MGYSLGVALGTSFTGVAVSRQGSARIRALGSSRRPPAHEGASTGRALTGPIPLVLGGAPPLPQLEGTLRSVLDSVSATEGGAPDEVVLTCPAVWGPVRREQFGEVSRRVGLHSVSVVSVVSEPEAAVQHFATAGRLHDGDLVVVYDVGAATVDVTVVRVTGPVPTRVGRAPGTEILGLPEALEGVAGVDFDDVLVQHVDQVLGGTLSHLDRDHPASAAVLDRLRAECVRAKERLSVEARVPVAVPLPWGDVQVEITREEFESLIREGLRSTLAGLDRAMASAGVGASDLAAVVLVGGSSKIPLVAALLAEGLGRPLLFDENPQHCAALGAAGLTQEVTVRPRSVRRLAAGTAGRLAGRLRRH